MAQHRLLTEKEHEQLVKWYERGDATYARMAEYYGTTLQTIHRYLWLAGVKRNRKASKKGSK